MLVSYLVSFNKKGIKTKPVIIITITTSNVMESPEASCFEA